VRFTSSEQCDDANSTEDAYNDGCVSCVIQPGWFCAGAAGALSSCTTQCGDAKDINSSEGCDDGNLVNLDACNSTC
jgi:cysteine-rich repeat protein